MKIFYIIIEKLKIGYILRIIHGIILNIFYPGYNLFKALALKSGLPGSDNFTFTTDGNKVTLVPMGQHLDSHGSDDIKDLKALKWDFIKPEGKIEWITKNRLYNRNYLSEFVREGPVRIHYLPDAGRLAAGGGRNRLMTLMRLGFWNARQLKSASWDEQDMKYKNGDLAINYPGQPVWDDIPPGTKKQGWVDKTKRWDDAYSQGLRLTMGDVYKAIF